MNRRKTHHAQSPQRDSPRIKVDWGVFTYLLHTSVERLKEIGFHEAVSVEGFSEGTYCRAVTTGATGSEEDAAVARAWGLFVELYRDMERRVVQEDIRIPHRLLAKSENDFLTRIQDDFTCVCQTSWSAARTSLGPGRLRVFATKDDVDRLKSFLKQRSTELGLSLDDDNDVIDGDVNNVSEDDVIARELKCCTSKQRQARTGLPLGYDVGGVFQVYLHQADLTKLRVGAVVNCANRSTLIGKSGVSRALANGAGPKYLRECQYLMQVQENTFPVSSVVRTCAGDLPCSMVLHTVGPEWPKISGLIQREKSSRDCRMKAYRTFCNILTCAEANCAKTLAIPPISSGNFSVPKPDVAAALFTAIKDASLAQRRSVEPLREVHLVDIDEDFLYIMAFKFSELVSRKSTFELPVTPLTTEETLAAIAGVM